MPTLNMNEIAVRENNKLVVAQIVAMPIDTYEAADDARRAAGKALLALEWIDDAEALPLLKFANRARNNAAALNPRPAKQLVGNSGP